MSARLAGKTCFVTGAAQGIGRSIAEAFRREGGRVIAADLDIGMLHKDAGDFMVPVQLDVRDSDAIRRVAAQHPGVSVVVNCAGYVAVGGVLECTQEDFLLCHDVNVMSVFHVVQAFLPAMRQRGAGSIVNIASVVSSDKAAAGRFAYAASKAAVLAMTRSIALDHVKDGIRCNAISPGTVATPSLSARIEASADPDAARRNLVSRQPMGRLGEPGEIAEVAVLLASDEARFMTGSNIVIDGGMTL